MMMNLPLAWAWVLLLRDSGRRSAGVLGAGALLGIAALIKQPAAIAVVAMGAFLALTTDGPAGQWSLATTLRRWLLLACGVAVSLGITVALLWHQGLLREAVYWSIGDHDVPMIFWNRAALHTLGFAVACLPLIVGSWLSLRARDLWRQAPAARVALAVWLIVSVVGTSASGRFHPHYYIQLLPPLAVLTAPAVAALWRNAPLSRRALRWTRVTAAWVALTSAAFFVSHIVMLRTTQAETEAGGYLRRHAQPFDRIVVWGQYARIYTDAERRSATRYFNTFPLTGYVFNGPIDGLDTSGRIMPGARPTFLREFDSRRPAFVVDTQSHAGASYPIRQFPELAQRLEACYHVEAETKEGVIYRREGCP
jgi:4-amino-4-deoxy-L-arabinose transferase-like glycosyltransferase